MTKKIIIYGKNGQVGTALANILGSHAVVFASGDYDFSDAEIIEKSLKDIPIKAIINATAYTDVNKAEDEEDAAYKANCLIPAALAEYAKEIDVPFIHYSTDYVFSGEGDAPYKESDATAPLNAYGRTKLAGEKAVMGIGGKYLIFRTSWVYDATHKNFLTTMLKLGSERESLSIVADQFGAPTYAPHLAMATKEILESILEHRYLARNDDENSLPQGGGTIPNSDFPSGIYHLCNAGETSWHGFACAIFDEVRSYGSQLKVQEVKPISAAEFPTPAKRPKNSRLDCSKSQKTFGITMPSWQDGLRECFKG